MTRLINISCIALSALSLYSCNVQEVNVESSSHFDSQLVLIASREDVAPDTKSIRLEDGSTWWNAAEEISVFYGSGTNGGSRFTSQNSEPQDIVEFSGSVQMSGSGKDFWALYPYSQMNECDGASIITVIPNIQTGSKGNFSDNVFPAIAKSNSLSLAFWNICGGVRFSVSRNDITSLTIKGNKGESLAGKVKIAWGDNGKPLVSEVIEASDEITISAPDGGAFEPGSYYYITSIPTELSDGFSITLSTDSANGIVVSDKAQTIKRSVFGTLKKIDTYVSEWQSDTNSPEAIDLGLSVKWASCNIGASKPEEAGDFYAWGELEPKEYYSWSNYKYGNSSTFLTKYNTVSSRGVVDNKTTLDPEDDVAYVLFGGNWRMPTYDEFAELINTDNCEWTWTEINNVPGYLVTSKVPGFVGNTIFLPAAGGFWDYNLVAKGTEGRYWPSTLSQLSYDATYCAYSLDLGPSYVYIRDSFRSLGRTIRPVYGESSNNKPILVSSIILDNTSLNLYEGDSYQLNATVSPSDATNPALKWTSSDESVSKVSDSGVVSALSQGTCMIYAEATDGSGIKASCNLSVYGRDYVDLGLSVKWATCNVGASNPEESGGYYAWGELETKGSYRWGNYRFNASTSDSFGDAQLTKYCLDVDYGYYDGKNILEAVDDVAHTTRGDNWRLPSNSEWNELLNNCTWEWETLNNVEGFRATSKKNGNSIFLPAVGEMWDSRLDGVGTNEIKGAYWSNEIEPSMWGGIRAYYFEMTKRVETIGSMGRQETYYEKGLSDHDRCRGRIIRPVYGDIIHPSSISLSKTSVTLKVGEYEQLTVAVKPENALDKSVSWSSDKPSVASVSAEGKVSALKAGTATITVTTNDGNLKASCSVNVESIVHVESVSLNKTHIDLKTNQTETLTATVLPSNASDKTVNWSSNKPSVVSVNNEGKVIALQAGSATITVTTNDGNYKSSCSVIVTNANNLGYVDLGLSVKWATCNVGASNPEESGGYYAWGELETKGSYRWGNYRFNASTSDSFGDAQLTKYCLDVDYGYYDGKNILEAVDDVAHTTRGDNWRLPSNSEWNELLNNCTWEWETLNNVEGFRATSKKNGNSIFLPAVGEMWDSRLDGVGTNEIKGAYWSNEIEPSMWGGIRAYYFEMTKRVETIGSMGRQETYYEKGLSDHDRCRGRNIRPVCP